MKKSDKMRELMAGMAKAEKPKKAKAEPKSEESAEKSVKKRIRRKKES